MAVHLKLQDLWQAPFGTPWNKKSCVRFMCCACCVLCLRCVCCAVLCCALTSEGHEPDAQRGKKTLHQAHVCCCIGATPTCRSTRDGIVKHKTIKHNAAVNASNNSLLAHRMSAHVTLPTDAHDIVSNKLAESNLDALLLKKWLHKNALT